LTYDAAILVAALGTIPALLAVSYGFARIDEMWLTQVNRVTKRVIPLPASA
jgi:sulfite exporter TauE/SafE